MEADRSCLDASFEALEKTYGSFEAYVKNGIGLTEKELEQFREKALV
ncbi:MAG: tyrosine-protein phosphatase [Enterocloster sp.]